MKQITEDAATQQEKSKCIGCDVALRKSISLVLVLQNMARQNGFLKAKVSDKGAFYFLILSRLVRTGHFGDIIYFS